MKNLLLTLIFLGIVAALQAQPDLKHSLYIKYKKCWPVTDVAPPIGNPIKIYQHSNGNLYAILTTNNGIKESSAFAKLTKQYDTIWTRRYGGSQKDDLRFIQELPNGDMVLSGTTNSKDGDLWYARPFAADEIWVMIVDTLGNIKRGRTYGGSGANTLYSTITSSDGNIYMSGVTGAGDYDFTHFQYSVFDTDLWYAKLDTNLNLIWVKLMSGNDIEENTKIRELSPSRLVVGVATSSTNADFVPAEQKSCCDQLILYIDSSGNVLWKHRYGGSIYNDLYDIVTDTLHKHIYAVGLSQGKDGDYTYSTTYAHSPPGIYADNVYFIRIDTNGVLKQAKMYGPSAHTCQASLVFRASLFHNNRVWASATITDMPQCTIGAGCGDADTNVNNLSNAFIAEVDSNCNLVGKYTVNGNGNDEAYTLFTLDNSLYFTGGSRTGIIPNTFSCDTTRNLFFVAGLGEAPLGLSSHAEASSGKLYTLYPNPASSTIQLNMEEAFLHQPYDLKVYDPSGRTILQLLKQKGSTTLDAAAWPPGTYTITLKTKQQTQTEKISKQ